MLPDFPIDKSYLVGGWMAATLWGAFTVLFALSLYTTYMHHTRRYFMTGACIVMWSLATAHIAFVLTRLIQAFIVHVHDDGGAVMYLANIANPLNRAKDMIYITTIFLGDCILVWRCFMVWNRNWYIIIFPCLMVVATGVSGYGAVGQFFSPNPFTLLAVHWASGMLAVSMVTNIVLTLLTAGRIWSLTHKVELGTARGGPNLRYRAVILVILETGGLVTLGKILEFTFFQIAPPDGLHGMNALYAVMDCMPQLMGLAPTIIVLAVNQGFTSPGSEAYSVRGQFRSRVGIEAGRNESTDSGAVVFAVRKVHTNFHPETTSGTCFPEEDSSASYKMKPVQ